MLNCLRRLLTPLVRKSTYLAAAAVLVATTTAAASSVPLTMTTATFSGDGSIGDYVGQLWYQYNPAPGSTDLLISIKNTSPVDNGGYLTGFLFNVDGKATATLDHVLRLSPTGSTSPDSQFFDVFGAASASPYKTPFEAGAALSRKNRTEGIFTGPGNPTRGLAVGETGLFAFNVTGEDAAQLNALSFLTQPSQGPNDTSAVFLARFMGFGNGASDKVPAVPGTAIPLPSAFWAGLVLMGGMGAMSIKRRMRR